MTIGCAALALMLSGPRRSAAQPQFTTTVDVVEVYVTVTDARGALVTDLSSQDFEVVEDDVRQTISTFVAGRLPLAIALAIDRSWSMAGEPLGLAKDAARAFLDALEPTDRATMLAIGSGVEALGPLSTERAALRQSLRRLDPWGSTNLYDAVVGAVDEMQRAAGRRALVLLTDGVDRYSSVTAAEALEHARRHDVLVYPVVTGARAPAFLVDLAHDTGGRVVVARRGGELAEVVRSVLAELRGQYLLGYTPARPFEAGGWRELSVRVPTRSGLSVRARAGYWAGPRVERRERIVTRLRNCSCDHRLAGPE